jgi:acyl-CoA synthetase (AMP-forming)/AMP-acid ligase II
MPEVAMVAVVPMPDADMGEKVCAYIQPEAGCNAWTFDDIIDFLKECKASVLQLPERIEFVDCMPFTKAEKIDKMQLRNDIVQKLGCECAPSDARLGEEPHALFDCHI